MRRLTEDGALPALGYNERECEHRSCWVVGEVEEMVQLGRDGGIWYCPQHATERLTGDRMTIPTPPADVQEWIECGESITKIVREAETFARVSLPISEPAYDPENTAARLEAVAARLAYTAQVLRSDQ